MLIINDMYEYLTNFADDDTTLKILSVNKKFNNDIYFERVIRKKYLCCVSQKDENEKWKTLFLRINKCNKQLKKLNIECKDKETENPLLILKEIEQTHSELIIYNYSDLDFKKLISDFKNDKTIVYIITEHNENLFNYFVKYRNIDIKKALRWLKYIIEFDNSEHEDDKIKDEYLIILFNFKKILSDKIELI